MIKFNSKADFTTAKFEKDADFTKIQCSDKVNFSGAQFNRIVDFTKAKIKCFIFYGETFNDRAIFKSLSIEENIKFHNVNLSKASFFETDVRSCKFITCKVDDRD